MFQLITQFGGYTLFAQIALGLFFLAFMMILFSPLTRPKSQMQHYARMALSDDLPSGQAHRDQAHPEQADAEHGDAPHE